MHTADVRDGGAPARRHPMTYQVLEKDRVGNCHMEVCAPAHDAQSQKCGMVVDVCQPAPQRSRKQRDAPARNFGQARNIPSASTHEAAMLRTRWEEKRRGIVSAVRSTYEQVVELPEAKKLEPDPDDMSITKRKWELKVKQWRDVLRACAEGPPGLQQASQPAM